MLLHRFFIQDSSVLEVKDYQPNTGIEIYEVLRVVGGIPLFFEDHLRRFLHSAWLCHLEIPLDSEVINGLLDKLIEINQIQEGNILFSYCFRPAGKFQAYFIPHYYPDEETIAKGVHCGLLTAERHDPNAKVIQSGLKEKAGRMMAEKGYFEVLLVNQFGKMTEGSRSNLFFIKDGVFITAPDAEVLPGITRQKALEILSSQGKDVDLKNLSADGLPHMDAAFLTGTSPKILPVESIENYHYTVGHPQINELIKAYDELILEYISVKKINR
jgi:branched-chain amino acid aminotransferase